jgi:hypothetical protein
MNKSALAAPINACNVIALLGYPLVFFGIGDSVGLMWMVLLFAAAAHPVVFAFGWLGIVLIVAALFLSSSKLVWALQCLGPACLLASAVVMKGLPYCLYFYIPVVLSLVFCGLRAAQAISENLKGRGPSHG